MFRTALVFALVATAFASLRGGFEGERRVVMEPEVTVFSSPRWTQVGRAPASKVVEVVVSLKHDEARARALEALALSVSNPKSNEYMRYLSQDELAEVIAMPAERPQLVADFLRFHGAKEVRVGRYGDNVRAKLAVYAAEAAFGVELFEYSHAEDDKLRIVRADRSYTLPASVAEVVSVVTELTRFPRVQRPITTPAPELEQDPLRQDAAFTSCGNKCSGFTTPEVLRERYGVPELKSATSGNGIGLAEFQYQYWDQTDIDAFNSACDTSVAVDTTIGGNNPTICTAFGGCVEALLDIEYAGALAAPIPMTVIYSSDYNLYDFLDQLNSMRSPPLVTSVSYGNDEAQQTSKAYIQSVDAEAQKSASLGLSVLFAAGDQGVWGREGQDGNVFHADFPAGSPYITAVGGTDFVTKGSIGEEKAWSCGGGGFSENFDRPSYQDDAVTAYLNNRKVNLPDSDKYVSTGRGYPDVSALGGQVNPYCVSSSAGKFSGVAGTSASSPVVAAVFAAINNVLLSEGYAQLGFLNPFIYQNGNCFNDVTQGENNCQRFTDGFEAASSWDPATGMGTPIYSCLLSAAKASARKVSA